MYKGNDQLLKEAANRMGNLYQPNLSEQKISVYKYKKISNYPIENWAMDLDRKLLKINTKYY